MRRPSPGRQGIDRDGNAQPAAAITVAVQRWKTEKILKAVYLVRGSVLSISFDQPDRPNRLLDQIDQIPATRRKMVPGDFFLSLEEVSFADLSHHARRRSTRSLSRPSRPSKATSGT